MYVAWTLIEPAEPLAIKAISAVVIGLVAYVIMSHQGVKHEHDEMAGEHAGMMQEHDLLKRISSDLKREVEMLKSKINSLMHRERKEKFCQPPLIGCSTPGGGTFGQCEDGPSPTANCPTECCKSTGGRRCNCMP